MTPQTIFRVFDQLADVPGKLRERGIAGQHAGRRDHAVTAALAKRVSP